MPSHEEAIEKATLLMRRFAERTGLTSDRPTQRYLWTDAFAVCNFLGLARLTGERSYADLALRLVDQVHHVLGRYRADDTRAGWISGLGEREGEVWPSALLPSKGSRRTRTMAVGAPSAATTCARGCTRWPRTSASGPRSCRRGSVPSISG